MTWNIRQNKRNTYALVNPEGKVIVRFRCWNTAFIMKSKYEKDHYTKMKIIKL